MLLKMTIGPYCTNPEGLFSNIMKDDFIAKPLVIRSCPPEVHATKKMGEYYN